MLIDGDSMKTSNPPSFRTALLILAVCAAPWAAAEPAAGTRLDAVAERGRKVMPFSLEETTHVFAKTERGGVQQVVAKDPANTRQIGLIRGHLAGLAGKFGQGDFSGPARIHGGDMPGLAELSRARPGQVRYRYADLSDGAEIEYSSDDPALIGAIHRYFDAQLSDHARHAMPGHPQHGLHGR
jgi:hypothetical protein